MTTRWVKSYNFKVTNEPRYRHSSRKRVSPSPPSSCMGSECDSQRGRPFVQILLLAPQLVAFFTFSVLYTHRSVPVLDFDLIFAFNTFAVMVFFLACPGSLETRICGVLVVVKARTGTVISIDIK